MDERERDDGASPAAEIVIRPGVGVGPLHLGMTKQEVEAVMGPPERRLVGYLDIEHWAWGHSLIQAQFDSAGTVGDIMVCNAPTIRASIDGVDVFNTRADQVVEELRGQLGGVWTEGGYSYEFRTSRGGFWRECLPDDVLEDDDQMRGGLYWDTVNISTSRHDEEVDRAAQHRS